MIFKVGDTVCHTLEELNDAIAHLDTDQQDYLRCLFLDIPWVNPNPEPSDD